jgi:pyruvate/2-oxoglutarate dehydrogenase complex dihydrolipoamide acyltransferase (E2) component
MQVLEIKVPDIGDFSEVTVIELLVKPGDHVNIEQSLITVESDKASMEIPSSAAGVIESLLIKLGDKVSEGTAIERRPQQQQPRKQQPLQHQAQLRQTQIRKPQQLQAQLRQARQSSRQFLPPHKPPCRKLQHLTRPTLQHFS